VCDIQRVIRFREAAWTPETCARVALALAETSDPLLSLAIAINESDLRPTVLANTRPGVFDVGLMGVRCVRGQGGRCTNGLVKGLSLAQLQDPETNIFVANQILLEKRQSHGPAFLRGYNGGVANGQGYAGKISALMSALIGTQSKVKGKRMRKLTAQILTVTQPRRSVNS
jgi:soluble lytic murein transglycosylase-like protein